MDHLFIRFLFLLSTKVHRLKEEDCISASIDDDEDRIEGVVQGESFPIHFSCLNKNENESHA